MLQRVCKPEQVSNQSSSETKKHSKKCTSNIALQNVLGENKMRIKQGDIKRTDTGVTVRFFGQTGTFVWGKMKSGLVSSGNRAGPVAFP